jgi:hypothetical protein
LYGGGAGSEVVGEYATGWGCWVWNIWFFWCFVLK